MLASIYMYCFTVKNRTSYTFIKGAAAVVSRQTTNVEVVGKLELFALDVCITECCSLCVKMC